MLKKQDRLVLNLFAITYLALMMYLAFKVLVKPNLTEEVKIENPTYEEVAKDVRAEISYVDSQGNIPMYFSVEPIYIIDMGPWEYIGDMEIWKEFREKELTFVLTESRSTPAGTYELVLTYQIGNGDIQRKYITYHANGDGNTL